VTVPVITSGPELGVSDDSVRVGDVFDLYVRAPDGYTWGLPTSLQALRDGKWRTLYQWSTWPGKSTGVLEAISIKDPGVWPAIGFAGSASFRLRIPDVEPGDYRITIHFTDDAVDNARDASIDPAVSITVLP
jgi:hypothetical protein